MSHHSYYVLDVFTDERFKGNPLAVVFTDVDLELSTYAAISKEFGYSETSFIYYSATDKALKIRSFTPTGFEINGAGHNLLGAVCAALFRKMSIFHEQEGQPYVLMKDEIIHLSTHHTNTSLSWVGMRQKPACIEYAVEPDRIAEALSLDSADLVVGRLVPTVVKTEVTHLMVPVKSLDILQKSAPNKARLIKVATDYQFEGVYCFSILDHDPIYYAQTRFFNPGIGIDEDPATGSAAGPLAGFLVHNGYIQQDTTYKLLQGVKMNQPSTISFEVKSEGIWVSGTSILVMEGVIYS